MYLVAIGIDCANKVASFLSNAYGAVTEVSAQSVILQQATGQRPMRVGVNHYHNALSVIPK